MEQVPEESGHWTSLQAGSHLLRCLGAWQSLSCLWHGSLVLSTVAELLRLRRTWEGEGTFLELKNTSPAPPLQGLGLSGYIPDPPFAVGKALCQTLLLESCPGLGDRGCCSLTWAGGMQRCTLIPGWWGELPVSVLMALLFFFSLLPVGAQEISLLLVSRVSLSCDPLLSGEVALESSLLPLFCLERPFFGRQRASPNDPFSQLHPWEVPEGPVPTWQSLRLHHGPTLAPILSGLPLGSEPCRRLCQPQVPLILGGRWGSPGTHAGGTS